jgi:hypothetical protein
MMLVVRAAYPAAVTPVTVNLQPLPLEISLDVEVATPFVPVAAVVEYGNPFIVPLSTVHAIETVAALTGALVPACVTVTDARQVKRLPDAVGPAMLVDETLRVGSGRGLQTGQGAAAGREG